MKHILLLLLLALSCPSVQADELDSLITVMVDSCNADIKLKGRQKWYNKEEMDAALLAATQTNNDAALKERALSLLQSAHLHFRYIHTTYSTTRSEVLALFQSTSKSTFPMNDSVRTLYRQTMSYYIKDEDHLDWMVRHLPIAKELRTVYTQFVKTNKILQEARLQLINTSYRGHDVFAQALSKAYADLKTCHSVIDFSQVADGVAAAQDAYLQTRPYEWVTIRNGQLWNDTNGRTVQAHAPGFVRVGDVWFMCGEDRSSSWNPDVNLYSSNDLVHWKFERKIIKNGVTTSQLGSSRFIERPKLLYNKQTGKYVVWCHYEQSNYGASEAACFECDSVNGDYTYVWSGRPLNVKSRDCNVFQDESGKAYFISTTSENTNLGLFELSDDYHKAISHTSLFNGQCREAPAIVRVGDRYFMFNSACSGWDPNQCKMAHSSNLKSGWTSLNNVGNNNAYDTQAAAILTIKGTKQTTYLYVGDRWQDPDLPNTKTIIFPISFDGTRCNFSYHERFDINFVTGEWRETPTDTILIDKSGWKVVDMSSQETNSEYSPATNAIDGKVSTFWHTKYSGTVATAPHSITIDLGKTYTLTGFLATPRMDGNTNGLIRNYTFQISMDGSMWSTVSSGSWLFYCAETNFPQVNARYVRLRSNEGAYASLAELDLVGRDASLASVEGIGGASEDKVTSREFYTIDGRRAISAPQRGIYIERLHYANGASRTFKYIK